MKKALSFKTKEQFELNNSWSSAFVRGWKNNNWWWRRAAREREIPHWGKNLRKMEPEVKYTHTGIKTPCSQDRVREKVVYWGGGDARRTHRKERDREAVGEKEGGHLEYKWPHMAQAQHHVPVMTAELSQVLMKITSNSLHTVLIVFSSLLNEYGWVPVSLLRAKSWGAEGRCKC